MRRAFVYLPGSPLSGAELGSCRLDGLLVEVGDGYLPADLPETAPARAASIAGLLRPELAAAGPSAAWIHGAGDRPPGRHHARPAVSRRLRAPSSIRLNVHESAVEATELVDMGGIRVTTPIETAIDLARGMGGADAHAWLAALAVAIGPTLLLWAQERLSIRHRMPGKRAALTALERAYDEVTRYTS
ncbi:type IV toxin-antitoxin system AbiEi family antitoxin [Microbacterium sp. NPDC055903]